MSKILIIPDVHGRKFWHKAEEIIDKVDKVVFLGDYLDPYPHEGILVDEAIQEFKQILEFKEKYNDKVVLLTGNHDWHYILKEFSDCSRRSYQHLDDFHELFTNNINKFKLIHLEDNYLFSHAGVYKTWMDKYKFTSGPESATFICSFTLKPLILPVITAPKGISTILSKR